MRKEFSMSHHYDELKKSLLADGVIDAAEVASLRAMLFADGVIDREEADLVFELNDATSGAKNDPSWQVLFVDAVTAFLLEDEKTPGVVDDDEAAWLLAHIEKDGEYDANEKALVKNLKAKAKSISAKLTGKL
jgi:hypothetical protein